MHLGWHPFLGGLIRIWSSQAEPRRIGPVRIDTKAECMLTESSFPTDPAIQAYYDAAPEETRLEMDVFRLEQVRTRELIVRHMPRPPGTVLDVGGAAGAYAFWLSESGFDVRLIDASPRLVEIARRRNETASPRLTSCRVGDARCLSEPD